MKNKQSFIAKLLAILVSLISFISICLGVLAFVYGLEGAETMKFMTGTKYFPYVIAIVGFLVALFGIYSFINVFKKSKELERETEEKDDDSEVSENDND